MFHHLRGHSRTWTFWPAAPRRRTPRTAYGPRLDRLEDRIAMSVTVSPGPQPDWLTFVEDGTDQQVDIHVVKNAGQDPVVTVTNANHVSFQQSEPGLAGLDVKAGGSESETSIDTTANAYMVDVLLTAEWERWLQHPERRRLRIVHQLAISLNRRYPRQSIRPRRPRFPITVPDSGGVSTLSHSSETVTLSLPEARTVHGSLISECLGGPKN